MNSSPDRLTASQQNGNRRGGEPKPKTPTGFVHLNVHSNFSLLAGADTVETLVAAAQHLGMPALALTDRNGLYAAVPFQRACSAAGIKPIFGAELELDGQRAIVLARDRSGYAEVCRIITELHLTEQFSLLDRLAALSDAVFVLTADLDLLKGLPQRPTLFAELTNFGDRASRQERYARVVLAQERKLSMVATNRVHFAEPAGVKVHRLLSAVRTNTTIGTLPAGAIEHPESYLKSGAAMQKLFPDLPAAVTATTTIAAECSVDLELGKIKPPRFELPDGESAFSYLCKLAFEGLAQRYRPISKSAYDALSRELDVISNLQLAEYFLICWDIVRHARSLGLPCLGRGSAANSIVSYCLWITHVDPLKHNLFFERFLNEGRSSLPDFDIDFGTEDREQILRYVFARYGEEKVAMICTYSTLRARGAMREVTKALGIPESEIDALVKRLPFFARLLDLEERVQEAPHTRELPLDQEPFRTIIALAKRIGDFPRHLATHPCGLVVAPEPITNYMPLERGDKGLIVTQWSMYPVEDAGLIKIDLLGQKGLAVITETQRMVQDNGEVLPDALAIDYFGDERTRRWMREGRSEGCFYIESPVMQVLLRQARCDDFEVLTALSSIIRPGVSNYGGKQNYLRRHLGLEPVDFMHPLLQPILADTYGCLIYQEQVIQIAAALAGMTLAEADGLRRCMSKKRNWEQMSTYKARFFAGARRNGVPEPIVAEVFRQIESFAGYAFCKAHSASFAVESFESMYWKSHYPAEFMAAVLSNQGGFYSPLEYVEEARRLGIRILPPCVQDGRERFLGKKDWLQIGLQQVKYLAHETIRKIITERDAAPFKDLFDFLARIQPERKELQSLILAGALDRFGFTRPQLLWLAQILFGSGNYDVTTVKSLAPKIPELPEFELPEKINNELKALEVAVSGHPLLMFPDKLLWLKQRRRIVPSYELSAAPNREVYCVGWRVTGKVTRTQTKQQLMEFITFSDLSGRYEAVFFPESFELNANELRRGYGPFLLKGKVQMEFGTESLIASNVKLL